MFNFKICTENSPAFDAVSAEYKKILVENVEKLVTAQAGESQYANSQDWLDTEICASGEQLSKFESLAKEIQQNADIFVLIGVGGSNNAARSVIEAIAPTSENFPKIVYAGNTLNPYALNKMLASIKDKRIYIDCIAKNFETLEPGSSFRLLRKYLHKVYGKEAHKHIIATGTKGSSLEKLCTDEDYTFLEFPLNVGGRYTAMTSVGLLPMAVAGIDIRALVRGAADMQKRLHTETEFNNIAYQYACARNTYYKKGLRVEMISSFEPQLRYFYKWWMQLFAESEGKDNKGIFPVCAEFSEDLHSIGQYIQDGAPIMFETFVNVTKKNDSLVIAPDDKADYFDYLDGKDFWDVNAAAFEATVVAHSQKLPCHICSIDAIDAYHFGQMFYFFQFACYVSCKIMGVNAFDQPGVEAYKQRMFKSLGKQFFIN